MFVEHHAFVLRALAAFGVGQPELDDATQDVFMVAYRKRESLAFDRPRGFLHHVARRVASNRRRNATRLLQKRLPVDPDVFERVSSEAGNDAIVSGREKADLVRRTLASMSPERAASFNLVVVEEMPVAEVSEILGISTHAVYRHVRAAKRSLADAIERETRSES